MIQTIDDYKSHAINFADMVATLEGSLYAGDFKDRALIDGFYEHWTGLETVNTLAANEATRYQAASDTVDAMQQFLKEQLSRPQPD